MTSLQSIQHMSAHNIIKLDITIGQSGLTGDNNTCFLNAAVQVLLHSSHIRNYFIDVDDGKGVAPYKNSINRKKNESQFVKEFAKLVNGMWEERCTCRPRFFLESFYKLATDFTIGEQNDAQEALSAILDMLHIGLSSEYEFEVSGECKTPLDKLMVESIKQLHVSFNKEYSDILNMTVGQHMSVITSDESDNEELSRTFFPFTILNLSISDNDGNGYSTLYECFDYYVKPESLTGDNKYRHPKTNKLTNVTKEIGFWKLPSMLIIALKRFSLVNSKLDNVIDFPINNLEMSKYTHGYDKYGESTYMLSSIINHHGGTSGGHYTASCKNHDDNWYNFDNRTVTPIKDTSSLITSAAYILIYSRKT